MLNQMQTFCFPPILRDVTEQHSHANEGYSLRPPTAAKICYSHRFT